jgi:hypothetical protein
MARPTESTVVDTDEMLKRAAVVLEVDMRNCIQESREIEFCYDKGQDVVGKCYRQYKNGRLEASYFKLAYTILHYEFGSSIDRYKSIKAATPEYESFMRQCDNRISYLKDEVVKFEKEYDDMCHKYPELNKVTFLIRKGH